MQGKLARSTPAPEIYPPQQHVVRFYISVNQACLVHSREGVRKGFREPASSLRVCYPPPPFRAAAQPGRQAEVAQRKDQLDELPANAHIVQVPALAVSPVPPSPLSPSPLLDKGGACWGTPPEWAQKPHRADLRKDGWVEGGMWGGYIVLKVLVSRKRGVGSDLWATLRGWAENCRSLIWVVWGNARLRKGWAGNPPFSGRGGLDNRRSPSQGWRAAVGARGRRRSGVRDLRA